MSRLRIAVTGLAVTYPFGGVFWDYVQYVLGCFHLGHDILYIEDTGQWVYDPDAGTFVENGSRNAASFASHLSLLEPGLANCWFYRDGSGACYGRSWADVVEYCRHADLFIHLSASCWMRDEYMRAARVAFVDSDPMYTQKPLAATESELDQRDREYLTLLGRHARHFTFGENVGKSDCLIPQGPFQWMPTRQPVVLDAFLGHEVPVQSRRRTLTTVASWEPSQDGPVVAGRKYYGKSAEFERFITLPQGLALPIEVAMSGRAPAGRLAESGWGLRDPLPVSRDPWVYREYLANSAGELSVAKHAYVASGSGWFSCRTACYLALGVPAIVQETGFSQNIPCGEGLFSFSTIEDAQEAVEAVASRPEIHASAAREIAREYFDSGRVITRLIHEVYSASAAPISSTQSGAH
jgi:hypothetical protein